IKSNTTAVNKELVPVYVAANVSTAKPAGTYRNNLVFSAIPNPTPTDYSLYFLPGTENPVTNLPSTMTASEVSAQHTFTIPSTAPSRSGYDFTGYLDSSTSTTYQPGDTITILGGETHTGETTLTAQWTEMTACTGGANRICYISNEPSGASSTVSGAMGDQTIVYMTSNTPTGSIDQRALSGSTTELTLYSPNWTLTNYGFKGWSEKKNPSSTDKIYGPNETITLSTNQKAALGSTGIMLYAQWVAQNGTMESFSCNSLANVGDITARTYEGETYAIAKLADGKCWMIENMRTSTNAGTDSGTNWTATISDRQYSLTNITGAAGADPVTSGTAAYQWKSYGGYYSWASAANATTIGTTQYTNWDTNSNSYIAGGSAQGICPTGWRLPRAFTGSGTNNQGSDFRYLQNILTDDWGTSYVPADSNKWREYPNNFIFAGYWGGTTSYGRGSRGGYWTSTVSINNQTYRMFITSNSIAPAYGSVETYQYLGKSVRCVFGS
ncbi:hypothetical protein IKW75_01795, partial [Candidatus Saccharibacteria bacterium]|nr:hypothetical protein [Candidatus Saccharibacteria bacterium]